MPQMSAMSWCSLLSLATIVAVAISVMGVVLPYGPLPSSKSCFTGYSWSW